MNSQTNYQAPNNAGESINNTTNRSNMQTNTNKQGQLAKEGYFAKKQAYLISINATLGVIATATKHQLSRNNMNLNSYDENYLTHCSEQIRDTDYKDVLVKLKDLVKPSATRYLSKAGTIALNMFYNGVNECHRLYTNSIS